MVKGRSVVPRGAEIRRQPAGQCVVHRRGGIVTQFQHAEPFQFPVQLFDGNKAFRRRQQRAPRVYAVLPVAVLYLRPEKPRRAVVVAKGDNRAVLGQIVEQ